MGAFDETAAWEGIEPVRRLARLMPNAIPPCPQWCDLGPGHPYDGERSTIDRTGVVFWRDHECAISDTTRIRLSERMRAEVVDHPVPMVIERGVWFWSVENAKKLAADLEKVFARLEGADFTGVPTQFQDA